MAGLVFNDKSLHGQFTDINNFADYCSENICRVLDLVNERGIKVYKCPNICELMVTESLNVAKIFLVGRGYPEFSKIRSQIITLLDSPFLDGEVKTVNGVEYEYPQKSEEPNCFTEAIEKSYALLSIKDGLSKIIPCKRNSIDIGIYCVEEMKDLLSYLVHDEPRKYLRDAIEKIDFNGINVCFAQTGTGYPAETDILDGGLTNDDIIKIVEGLPKMIDDKRNGNQTSSWKHLRDSIYEYRINISSGRIYRILFSWEKKMVLLSGFVKKVDKTPLREISRAQNNLKTMK